MYSIGVLSSKGGTGKTTVAVNLACALRDKGYRTMIIDADFATPNVLILLNAPNAKPKLDKNCIIIPPEIEGLKVLSWGMIWKEGAAITIEDTQIGENELRTTINLIKSRKSDAAIKYLEQLIENPGGVVHLMKELFRNDIVNFENTEFVVVDTPPSMSGSVRAVVESNLNGSIIVTGPSRLSLADVARTIDMLRKWKVPTYGLILNALTRFELKEKDVIKFCQEQKLPLIYSIPFSITNLDEHFSAIADYIISHDPIILEQEKIGDEWKRTVKDFERVANILSIFKE